MTGLLGKNSDYMKRAETKGLQTANTRGLLNSSLAAGAAQAAAIDAALPIAQQDASTYSGFSGREQQFDQQTALNADQFAQERAVKQFEQENLSWSQYLKGYADIAMQDLDPSDKANAQAKLAEQYIGGNPISKSLEGITIKDGKIVRSGGTEGTTGTGTDGTGTATGTQSAGKTDPYSYSSVYEMPQTMAVDWAAKYGNLAPSVVKQVSGIITQANNKFGDGVITKDETSYYGGRNHELAQIKRRDKYISDKLAAMRVDPTSVQQSPELWKMISPTA
jgi:hypothetical protein